MNPAGNRGIRRDPIHPPAAYKKNISVQVDYHFQSAGDCNKLVAIFLVFKMDFFKSILKSILLLLFVAAVSMADRQAPQIYVARSDSTTTESSDPVWGAPVPVPTFPPSHHAPAPAPSYYAEPAPAPAPSYYADPAPSYYPEPAPAPSYSYYQEPAPAPAPSYYPAPAPAPAPAPIHDTTSGYYYYYYPVKESKGGLKGLKGHLTREEKSWLGVLVPLVAVAIGIPILSLILSGKSVGFSHNIGKFGWKIDHVILFAAIGAVVNNGDNNARNWNGISGLRTEVTEMVSTYTSVMRSEECVQKMICQLGATASGMPAKSYIFP